MSLAKVTWGTTLKVKVWHLMSPWRASISPSEWASRVNCIWLNTGEKYKTLVCMCPFLCQCISHGSLTCLIVKFFWFRAGNLVFGVLTDMTWQAETSLSKWNIRAMKAFAWNMEMHGNIPLPPTSPTFIFPFVLHSCQSFLVLCINITFPQRRHIFTLNSTDQKSIYVTAVHPSLSWDWGPTVMCCTNT